jgi:outer membrane lipoprotein-sorting protein
MKQISFLIYMLLSLAILQAQDSDKGDKKSNAILEALTAKTEAYKSIRVEFTYKMENLEAGIDESTRGALLVMGNKYKLNISGQEVFCDGETLWTYIADAEEVQVNSMEEAEGSISPNKLLSSYSDEYRSKFVREDFVYGTTVNIIDLTPIEGKSYYKVRLTIDKEKDQLLEFTIFDKNGSTYSYVINKFEPNVDVTEQMFTFNPADHPGVDVIDMR